MPEVGLPNDVTIICPQIGITAGSLLGLLTGHLRYICLNRQAICKCLLTCSKRVICGGVRAERGLVRCFHTPHSLLFVLHWWPEKDSCPTPLPSCCRFLGAPRTLGLIPSPSCPQHERWVWMSQLWCMTSLLETFTSPNAMASPKSFYVLLLLTQPTCSECASVHSSFSVYQDQLCRVSTVSCLPCQGMSVPFKKCMKYPCVLDSAKHFGLFCHFPSTSSFATNSLLDTKKDEVSLKPDLEPKHMCPSMSGVSGAHQLMLYWFPKPTAWRVVAPPLVLLCGLLGAVPTTIIFPPSTIHIHIAAPLAHLQPGSHLVGLSS